VLLRGGTVYAWERCGSGDGRRCTGRRPDRGGGQLEGRSAAAGRSTRAAWPYARLINFLSWSTESLIADGRSQGELRAGVTLEVMGEGNSMGPLNPA